MSDDHRSRKGERLLCVTYAPKFWLAREKAGLECGCAIPRNIDGQYTIVSSVLKPSFDRAF